MSRPSTTPANAGAPTAISSRMRVIGTVGVILALALASIDVSIVSTAMPRIADDLSGLDLYAWVGISYAVLSVVMIPIAGKLGDMFGRKPFLLAGIVGFIIASFLCGAAQTMLQLVVFRGVQGLFAGVLMANIFTVVADMFAAEKRVQMQGVFFSVAGLSMVIGPLLGGFITDNWNWRWVFYVNVPTGLLAGLAVLAGVPYVRSRANWRDIDFLGVVTLLAGLVPILIGLSLPGLGHAWSSPEVWSLLVTGALLLTAFFLVERRLAKNPILPVDMFRNNQFAVMVVVAFFSALAMAGTIFYVPLLYQGVLGVSATHSGTLVIPLTLALMIVPPIAGKALTMVARYRFLGTFAFACMVAGLLLLTRVGPGDGSTIPVIAMILVGIGIGITFPMATSVAQSAVPMSQLGVATSQIQFWRMMAGPVGLAVLGTILASRLGGADQTSLAGGGTGAGISPEALADGMRMLFLVAAALVTIGLVATLFLKEVPLRQMPKKAAGPAKTAQPAGSRS